jgi:glycerate dehydrogenase
MPTRSLVVLDGYTLNPGDLSWSRLEQIANCVVYDRTSADEILQRAAGAELLLTNKTPVRPSTIEQCPELKYIGVLATGYDVVDIAAARARHIVVSNVPTYGTNSVAQLVFALLLEICHHVKDHSDSVHHGDWSRSKDWSYWNTPLVELAGKKMGIIGFGRIGRQTGGIAHAFGMEVLATDRIQPKTPVDYPYRWMELDGLLRDSDVISLHCPLTPETRHIINRDRIELMKPSAILINTSRGPLVNDEDVAEALRENRIAAAAIDVLSQEPPPPDHPLLSAPRCIITPHLAWATREARSRLLDTVVDNVAAFLRGTPQNVVS